MNKEIALSYKHNMSLGFVPIITTLILSFFLNISASIYVGTALGVGLSYLAYSKPNVIMPNFILYISTFILLLCSLLTSVNDVFCPSICLPISLEAGVLIPILTIYINKKIFIESFLNKRNCCRDSLMAQSAELSIVSARITLILATMHFLAITIFMILEKTMIRDNYVLLYRIVPIGIFVFTIVLNQISIKYFNKSMKRVEYIPIINDKGEVIGKAPAYESLTQKQDYATPYVRIAVCVGNKILMKNKSAYYNSDDDRIDLAKECYIKYGEQLNDSVKRITKDFINTNIEPTFNVKHKYEDNRYNKLIYLYTLYISDEEDIKGIDMGNYSLWSIENIEANIGKNFFSPCFEMEFSHIKEVIYIREKYMEV